MPRYSKKRRLTHKEVVRALSGPNRKFLKESRGHEIRSPINDCITWQALVNYGTVENAKVILDTDGQEAQSSVNTHASFMINKHKVQLHGRNCGAQPCMMKFWVLTNLNDIYGETNSTTGTTNPVPDSTNPNLSAICIQDLVYGWDVQMQANHVITTFNPNSTAAVPYWDQATDLANTSNWGLTAGTNPNPNVLVAYNHDNPAAGVANTSTYCLARIQGLGLHNSQDFLKKWKIIKKGDFKLNPGDDYYINVNVPSFHYRTRPPYVAQTDDDQNAGLMFCEAKKGIVVLVKACGCLGVNVTTDANGEQTAKSGYMKFQIPYENKESASWYKWDDVDINMSAQLWNTDDVENTTLTAGTTATAVSGDGGS